MSEIDPSSQNADGTFKIGNQANPTGENGRRPTGMPWKMRANFIEEKYPTLEDLLQFFDVTFDDKTKAEIYKPNSKLKKMPHRDATIIVGLFEEFVGSDKIRAREAYWDRHDGKPTQRNELTGRDGGPIVISTDEAADAVRSKLLPELTASDPAGKT